jgi:hypothetical protein
MRGEDEDDADLRLHLGPLALGPGQQPGQTAASAANAGRGLHPPAAGLDVHQAGDDDAEAGDLRDREVDEDDARLRDADAERTLRREHEQAGEERRQQVVASTPTSSRRSRAEQQLNAVVEQPNGSLALSLPPTVNGRTTAGMRACSDSHCEARGSSCRRRTTTFAGCCASCALSVLSGSRRSARRRARLQVATSRMPSQLHRYVMFLW